MIAVTAPASVSPVGLPADFAQHFAREEAALDAMIASLRAVRAGLLKNDTEAFAAALEQQSQAAHESDGLHPRRREVLDGVAKQLGLAPENLTLTRVAEALSGDAAGWVHEFRRRLAAKAAEMQKLNRQNAAIIRHSVELTREVLATLTKNSPGGVGYDSSGARQESVAGSIFEVGG